MGSGVLALHEITDWNLEAIEVNRPTLFPVRMCKLLKARVAAQRSEHWIEPEQRWSERHVFSQRPCAPVSRVVSVKRRWRDRVRPRLPPPGQESRSAGNRKRRLSRSAPWTWPFPPEPRRRICHQDPYWSTLDLP